MQPTLRTPECSSRSGQHGRVIAAPKRTQTLLRLMPRATCRPAPSGAVVPNQGLVCGEIGVFKQPLGGAEA